MSRDDRTTTNRWRWIGALAVAYVLAVVIDLVVGGSYPGVIPALGFAGCALLIAVSKWLAGHLQRPEGSRPGGGLDG